MSTYREPHFMLRAQTSRLRPPLRRPSCQANTADGKSDNRLNGMLAPLHGTWLALGLRGWSMSNWLCILPPGDTLVERRSANEPFKRVSPVPSFFTANTVVQALGSLVR